MVVLWALFPMKVSEVGSLAFFTISRLTSLPQSGPFGAAEEMLMTDAFGNFRQILGDVTLAPAMGQFLDMANNPRANAANFET